MNLQLSLTKKWFDLTKSEVKTEDYREITDYWCRRLLISHEEIEWSIWNELIEDLNNPTLHHSNLTECMKYFNISFKEFNYNIMTLGYPKATDSERILRLEHKGIEIRTGNPEWGAEPCKFYFVIKHGNILK